MATSVDYSSVSPTKPLYQYEESLRKHLARVTAIRSFAEVNETEKLLFKTGGDSTFVLECNETIFYAQGGGQPYDTGYLTAVQQEVGHQSNFIVEAVRNGTEGRVYLFGYFAANNGGVAKAGFAAGDIVEQHVDDARRNLHSRIHTAGHIVALAVLRLAESEPELQVVDGKAQHYPDASSVEFKGLIDGKHKDAISSISNQFVKDTLPVNIYWCKPEEVEQNKVIVPEGMPVLTGLDGMVRVVDIVGAGAYPCGGTHTRDTSYVKEITVRNIKRQKGITKVSYVVEGQRE